MTKEEALPITGGLAQVGVQLRREFRAKLTVITPHNR